MSVDIAEEEHAALGPDGERSVSSLATAAVVFQERLRQANMSLDQMQQVSKADDEISFLPSSCCMSLIRATEVSASCSCQSSHCIITMAVCTAGCDTYTHKSKMCDIK